MNTKNIFKALALAMLMPAMLLTASCSNEDDAVNNTENIANKGYALPVTVNVTRQGDNAGTRATYTYDNTTEKGTLAFSTGDKLFVKGQDTSAGGAGFFAGTLTWQSGGSFSGTILTQNEYPGTIDELFTAGSALATLLPAGYETYGYLIIKEEGKDTYSASLTYDSKQTFATSKATAVEQFSFEVGGYTSGTGFALSPSNAILNFTITDLTANTEVAVALSNISYSISGNVTTNASGTATFAMSLVYSSDLKDWTLTVGGNPITLVSSSTVLERGHIYNITRSAVDPNAPLPGIFSISATQTVQFSKGNLQYQASTGTWRFAEHQYDYVGKASMGNVYVGSTKSNNESISETYTGWIDLFGWGTSGKTFASGYGTAYQPWATSATDTDYGPTGSTSGLTGTYANGDWGVNMGTGWRTLTKDQWSYLFNTRTTGGTVFGTAQARYTEATINTDGTGVNGIILFPDGVDIASGEVTTAGDVNNSSAWATECTTAQWAALDAKGCVFLPAAGYRFRNDDELLVSYVGSRGYYWSSTPYDPDKAYYLRFLSSTVSPTSNNLRSSGYSVRLVQDVVTP